MHNSIEQLLKVQGVDNEIRFLREAMAARPRELADEEKRLAEAKARVDHVVAHIRGVRMEIHKGELEVKRRDDEIRKHKIALNSAKTNEEFAVLKAQIEKLSQERGNFEEEVIVKLDEVEEAAAIQRQLEEKYAEEEKRLGRKKADVDGIVASLDEKLRSALAQRETLRQGIHPEHLEIYERVLHRHGNAAIAAVRDNCCNGCHMSVNPQEIHMLTLAQELIRCRSCSRLLYLD